jgi:parvulin-like peptidyl-prolyl isomerase
MIMQAEEGISETQWREYYEENKDKYFYPAQYYFRMIFLSTYIPYTVQEGDTLDAIARMISKDPELKSSIISAKTKKNYRRLEQGMEVYINPVVGEGLLVPVSTSEKLRIKEKMRLLRNRAQSGDDFAGLAFEYSNSPQKDTLIGPISPETLSRPMLPALRKAIVNTPVDEISNVVEAQHGFYLVKVERKDPASYTPFEKVKDSIRVEMANDVHQKKLTQIVDESWKMFNPLIHYEILGNIPLDDQDVLIEIMGTTITLGQCRPQLEDMTNKIEQQLGLESTLKKVPLVQDVLFIHYSKSKGFDNDPAFQELLEQQRISFVSELYLNNLVTKIGTMDDNAALKIYKRNKNLFVRPRHVLLGMIRYSFAPDTSKANTPKAKERAVSIGKELSALTAQINTRKEFIDLANSLIEKDNENISGGDMGYMPDTAYGGLGGRLKTLQPGEMSQPFVDTHFVYVLRIDGEQPSRPLAFEEVKEAIALDYLNEHFQIVEDAIRDVLFEKSGLAE